MGNLVKDVQSGITKISWSPYGKALEISKGTGQSINFGYDASGNRVRKSLNGSTTYYVRDASGNTMGVYQHTGTELKLTEQPIYGSARVGQRQPNLTLGAALATGEVFTRTLGMKMYELSDHLGNVRTVLSDRKKLASDGSYEPDVHSYTGYYAFGMQMQDRTGGQPDAYRYGYNGKEKDSNGEWGLTSYDYGFRIYNPAIGRFLSVDPLTKSYPSWSPYPFAMNRPIDGIDLDGLEFYKQGTYLNFKLTPVLTSTNSRIIEIQPDLVHMKQKGALQAIAAKHGGEEMKNVYDGVGAAVDLPLEFKDFVSSASDYGKVLSVIEKVKSVTGIYSEFSDAFDRGVKQGEDINYRDAFNTLGKDVERASWVANVFAEAVKFQVVQGDADYLGKLANFTLDGTLPKLKENSLGFEVADYNLRGQLLSDFNKIKTFVGNKTMEGSSGPDNNIGKLPIWKLKSKFNPQPHPQKEK